MRSTIWLVGDDVTVRAARRWTAAGLSCVTRVLTVPEPDLAGPQPGIPADERPVVPWLISVNCRTVFKPAVLSSFAGRAINIHPGRLPDFAGLHAVQWAVRLGEHSTAATAHFMTETVDAGDIIDAADVPLSPHDTGLSAWLRCRRGQADLLWRLLAEIAAGRQLPRASQDLSGRRVFRAADALGDEIPVHRHAAEVERWVRAANYRPFASPTYNPALTIPEIGLTLRLDDVAVAAAPGLAPGQIALRDNSVMVGCGSGSAIVLTRVRISARPEPLPTAWSAALRKLTPSARQRAPS